MPFMMLYRTVIIYFLIFTLLRIMGKRELGQLSTFDLVVAIMMAETSVLTIEDDTLPVYIGIIPILTLFVLQVLVSKVTIKNRVARAVIEGKPSILINKGRIQESELRSVRLSINDLLSQLRQKSIHNIDDVDYAILEPSGYLSVIQKIDKRPATKEDMNVDTLNDDLPVPMILDGEVEYEHLKKFNLSEEWLKSEIKKRGFGSPSEIFYACLLPDGKTYVSPKDNYVCNYDDHDKKNQEL